MAAAKPITAWLLDIGGYFAISSEWEMLHLLPATQCRAVASVETSVETETALELPLGRSDQVIFWQDQDWPVYNLKAWLEAGQAQQPLFPLNFPFVGIIALGIAPTQTGAIFLAAKPRQIHIAAESPLAPLPEPVDKWQALAISCVEYEQQPVPILDFPFIFGHLFRPAPRA